MRAKKLLLSAASSLAVLALCTPSLAQFGLGGGGGASGGVADPDASGVPAQGESTLRPGSSGPDVEALAGDLGDPDPAVRLEAVKSLAEAAKDEGAIQHLIDAMSDQDTRVRLKAIDCLGQTRASSATPVLVQTLYLRDSEPWLKKRVLVALGKIGDPRAAKAVADFLGRDTEPELLGTAIFSLGEIGTEESVPALEVVAQGTSNERLALLANDAIGKIRQRQVNPEIEIQALRPGPGDIQRPATASAAPPLAGF